MLIFKLLKVMAVLYAVGTTVSVVRGWLRLECRAGCDPGRSKKCCLCVVFESREGVQDFGVCCDRQRGFAVAVAVGCFVFARVLVS